MFAIEVMVTEVVSEEFAMRSMYTKQELMTLWWMGLTTLMSLVRKRIVGRSGKRKAEG